MNPHIFREYDIRGLVDGDLDADTVAAIGRAYGGVVGECGGKTVAVGMDVRESSPALTAALETGILAAGIDVVRVGVVPTPVLYFAVADGGLGGGVQVTGSHNPPEFNGFKMMRGTDSLSGPDIQDIRRRIETGGPVPGGGAARDEDVRPRYLKTLLSRIRLARPLRVVLDAGNGCAWELAPRLFRELGCDVECLYCEPDGRFPNHIPDPTLPETLTVLRERVTAGKADLGVAYDGDADRLGAVDGTGRILWGDQLLALFAREVLCDVPGAKVLFEVKCSEGLAQDIRAHGGEPVMTRTGHSLIKKAMKETGSPLAGEMSGHMFFGEWFGFDDALYASARLARIVAASEDPLAAMVDSLPRYEASPEIRVDCPDDRKFAVVAAVLDRYRRTHEVIDIDGARILFPGGWGLVRASNTQPVLVVRVEGKTAPGRDAILSELGGVLEELGVEGPVSG